MKEITICGGGSLGHVVACWLSAHRHAIVNILTNRPKKWRHDIIVDTPTVKFSMVVLIISVTNQKKLYRCQMSF